jgi:large subunit ribosomal protein L12e
MAGKPDFTKLEILTCKFCGGEGTPKTFSQKTGKLGVQVKQIDDDLKKVAAEYKGIRVTSEIHVQNKAFVIKFKPGVTPLIVKAMGDYVRDRQKQKLVNRSGNISFDEVIKISKWMESEGKSRAKTFKGSVKQVLGSCLSVGCTIDGKSAKQVTKEVEEGILKCN